MANFDDLEGREFFGIQFKCTTAQWNDFYQEMVGGSLWQQYAALNEALETVGMDLARMRDNVNISPLQDSMMERGIELIVAQHLKKNRLYAKLSALVAQKAKQINDANGI